MLFCCWISYTLIFLEIIFLRQPSKAKSNSFYFSLKLKFCKGFAVDKFFVNKQLRRNIKLSEAGCSQHLHKLELRHQRDSWIEKIHQFSTSLSHCGDLSNKIHCFNVEKSCFISARADSKHHHGKLLYKDFCRYFTVWWGAWRVLKHCVMSLRKPEIMKLLFE